MADTATAPPRSLTRAGLRRVLVTLCVTEITSWGVLYYAFPVLATDISVATGWSPAAVTAGFSAGQVVAALTALTLIAGLASTVFAPLTAALAARLDWRQTYLVLAVILAVVTIPGHLWGLRGRWPAAEPPLDTASHDPAGVVRSRAFLALLVALSLAGFTAFAVVINLVPLLLERGFDIGTAALALGLGGAGQVLGRVGYAALTRRTSVRARTALILLATSVTTAVLGLLTSALALIVAAVVAGMARGVFTLLQATAVTDRWGAVHYGRLSGLLAAPLTITMATAPWAGAALAGLFGAHATTFLVLGAVNLVAVLLALASIPSTARRTTP